MCIRDRQDLFQLTPVGLDAREADGEILDNADLFFRPSEKTGRSFHDGIHIDRPDGVIASLCNAEQLAGEIRAAGDQLFDGFQFLEVRIVLARVQHHQRRIALDAHQKVVEIVGESSREDTDGLHLLGVDVLGFQLPALRDVSGNAAQGNDLAAGIADRNLDDVEKRLGACLLYTSPSPRDRG